MAVTLGGLESHPVDFPTHFARGSVVATSVASIEIATRGNDVNKKVSQRAHKHDNK